MTHVALHSVVNWRFTRYFEIHKKIIWDQFITTLHGQNDQNCQNDQNNQNCQNDQNGQLYQNDQIYQNGQIYQSGQNDQNRQSDQNIQSNLGIFGILTSKFFQLLDTKMY